MRTGARNGAACLNSIFPVCVDSPENYRFLGVLDLRLVFFLSGSVRRLINLLQRPHTQQSRKGGVMVSADAFMRVYRRRVYFRGFCASSQRYCVSRSVRVIAPARRNNLLLWGISHVCLV